MLILYFSLPCTFITNNKGFVCFDKVSKCHRTVVVTVLHSVCFTWPFVCSGATMQRGRCLCMCSDPGQNPSWPRPAPEADVSSLSQASPQGCFQFSSLLLCDATVDGQDLVPPSQGGPWSLCSSGSSFHCPVSVRGKTEFLKAQS